MSTGTATRVIVESLPPAGTGWIDILSGLLTPVIAIIAVYIAYQQYRIQHLKFRHETYERRLGVYKAVQAFLSEIIQEGTAASDTARQFYVDASEAAFLFDAEIQQFIDELYSKAIDLRASTRELYPSNGSDGLPQGEERNKAACKNSEIFDWFISQSKQSKDLFRKHMAIVTGNPKNRRRTKLNKSTRSGIDG